MLYEIILWRHFASVNILRMNQEFRSTYESISATFSRLPVCNDNRLFNFTELLEKFLQRFVRCMIGKTSNEDLCKRCVFLLNDRHIWSQTYFFVLSSAPSYPVNYLRSLCTLMCQLWVIILFAEFQWSQQATEGAFQPDVTSDVKPPDLWF